MHCNITCRDLIQSELESHIISETETNLKDKLNKVVSPNKFVSHSPRMFYHT